MDSMVEENGNSSLDPLALPLSSVSVTATTTQSDNSNNSGAGGGAVSVGGSGSTGGGSIVSGSTSGGNITVSPAVLAPSIVQILPTQATSVQVNYYFNIYLFFLTPQK